MNGMLIVSVEIFQLNEYWNRLNNLEKIRHFLKLTNNFMLQENIVTIHSHFNF